MAFKGLLKAPPLKVQQQQQQQQLLPMAAEGDSSITSQDWKSTGVNLKCLIGLRPRPFKSVLKAL